jgi:NADPH:quinone reductase
MPTITTMRAVVLDAPDPASALWIRELPVPTPCGLDSHRGQGVRPEQFGVALSPWSRRRHDLAGSIGRRRSASSRPAGGEFAPGQQVAALAAGMGRVFDDGYAELTSVPVNRPISSGGSSKCGSVCSASNASDAVVVERSTIARSPVRRT